MLLAFRLAILVECLVFDVLSLGLVFLAVVKIQQLGRWLSSYLELSIQDFSLSAVDLSDCFLFLLTDAENSWLHLNLVNGNCP